MFESSASKWLLALAHMLLLLFASVVARLLFLHWLPTGVYSADVGNWTAVYNELSNNRNPYNSTTYLNWPPFWMQIIFLAGQIAHEHSFEFVSVVRCILMTAESALLLLTYATLREFVSPQKSFWLALFGIALNPISILLVAQHCNFDVFVGLFVLLALYWLVRFNREPYETDWIGACASLGLGALAKTVPLVLGPALAFGLRRVSWRSRFLGAALLIGPVLLGMSIVYVLGPKPVTENVLQYRSLTGWFGITGLLGIAHKWHTVDVYSKFFPKILFGVALCWGLLALRRTRARREELALCFLGLLILIPGIGPGYAPQYIHWFLALLPVAFAASRSPWVRTAIALFLVIAIGTYILEYAIFESHGAFWAKTHPTATVAALSAKWSAQPNQVWLRMPLFIGWMLLIAAVYTRTVRVRLTRRA